MKDFLIRQIRFARGSAPGIQPVLRTRYEPREAGPETGAEDSERAPDLVAKTAIRLNDRASLDAGPARLVDPVPRAPMPQWKPENRREAPGPAATRGLEDRMIGQPVREETSTDTLLIPELRHAARKQAKPPALPGRHEPAEEYRDNTPSIDRWESRADSNGVTGVAGERAFPMEIIEHEIPPEQNREPGRSDEKSAEPESSVPHAAAARTEEWHAARMAPPPLLPADLPASPPARGSGSQPEPPSVHVTIGRIEVRAVTQQPRQKKLSPPAGPHVSLDDYLKNLSKGKR